MATRLRDGITPSAPAIASSYRSSVLIFDSGVGGLSVYEEVRSLLPDLHFLYAFDNEAFPYGEKSEPFIVDRVIKIVRAISQRYPLSLVIIACNTASTVTLPALRERFAFPVIGVVPAIKPAACLTQNGVIGLLATHGTIARAYTLDLITRFASECKTVMLGSAELVELAEEKIRGYPVPLKDIRHILRPWLSMAVPPDTVVLGCTHFPLLSIELRAVLPAATHLIDSGGAIARRVVWLLANEAPSATSNDASRAFCSKIDEKSEQLLPALKCYGFNELEELVIRSDNL